MYINSYLDVYTNPYFHVLFYILQCNASTPLSGKVQQLYILEFVVNFLEGNELLLENFYNSYYI